jgi:hypothetical protein
MPRRRRGGSAGVNKRVYLRRGERRGVKSRQLTARAARACGAAVRARRGGGEEAPDPRGAAQQSRGWGKEDRYGRHRRGISRRRTADQIAGGAGDGQRRRVETPSTRPSTGARPQALGQDISEQRQAAGAKRERGEFCSLGRALPSPIGWSLFSWHILPPGPIGFSSPGRRGRGEVNKIGSFARQPVSPSTCAATQPWPPAHRKPSASLRRAAPRRGSAAVLRRAPGRPADTASTGRFDFQILQLSRSSYSLREQFVGQRHGWCGVPSG